MVKPNNEAAVEQAVRRWAEEIAARRPEVRRIVWFGSRVSGMPSPGSDVDVCLVLARADKPFRERAGDYLPLGFPVGLDLFPYTLEELDRLRREHPAWHQALTAGVNLLAGRRTPKCRAGSSPSQASSRRVARSAEPAPAERQSDGSMRSSAPSSAWSVSR